jgi:tight adherence protein C
MLYLGVIVPRLQQRFQARLATYLGGYSHPAPATQPGPGPGSGLTSRRIGVGPLTALSSRLMARLPPQRQLDRLRRMLAQAGFPTERQLRLFLAGQLGLAVVLGTLGFLMLRGRPPDPRGALVAPVVVVTLVLLGIYLPYFWLRRRLLRRRKAMLRALADALDLMAIGVSAGLSLDGAMLEVVQKWEGALSRELHQVLNEIRMGTGRRQALLNLAERTQLEDIRLLVAALVQAEELGTNISETLTIQSEQLRIRRRQLAEENARKAPIKMLIPLVFMIFPALFVVILGPGALALVRTLRRMALG